MLKHHVDGAVRMVALRGGPHSLGLDGLLEHLLSKLLSKILDELGLRVRTPWDTQVGAGGDGEV